MHHTLQLIHRSVLTVWIYILFIATATGRQSKCFHADVLSPSIDKEVHVFLVREEKEYSSMKGNWRVDVIFLTLTALLYIAYFQMWEVQCKQKRVTNAMLLKLSLCNHNVFILTLTPTNQNKSVRANFANRAVNSYINIKMWLIKTVCNSTL